MGWFDEQIRERKDADRKMFEDSFQAIAGAVMGKNLSEALNDERTLTADAFAVILRYYHIKAGEVPEDIKDMNEVLEFLMRPHGIMRRSVRLDRGWYKDSMGALLGRRTDDGSVIALIPRGISGYVFYDRDKEQYVRIGRKNEDMIDTEALAFYKPFPLKSMNIADLVRYLFEQIRISDYVMLFSTMGAATLVGMLLPKLNSILFSDVLSSKSVSMLLGIAIYMLCATISTMLVRVVSNLASERIGNKLDLSVESASMMRVLTLPAGFFKDYSAGELSNRIAYINSLANQLVSVLFISGLSGKYDTIIADAASCFREENIAVMKTSEKIVLFERGRRKTGIEEMLGDEAMKKLIRVKLTGGTEDVLAMDECLRQIFGKGINESDKSSDSKEIRK